MSRKGWIWPLGLAVAGIGSAAAVLLRGCWHRNMSWPIKDEENPEFAYQVCMSCGAKRAFDESAFRGYGAYSYDLGELIAREREQRVQRAQRAAKGTAEAAESASKVADPGSKSA